MKVFINLSQGFRTASKTIMMVILLFVINLAFSLLLAVPMYRSLQKSIGTSMVGERMAKGFDYLWWEEFRDQGQGLEMTFRPSLIGKGALLDNLEGLIQMQFLELPSSLIILGLFYIILHTFLAGGILSVFNQPDPHFTMRRFFEGTGKYFFRFFLIMLLSWLFFIIIGFFARDGLYSILDNAAKNARTELTPFFLGIFFYAIILFLILFIQMVFDYARIRLVAEEEKDIIHTSVRAFGFVFKNLGSTLGLYYMIFLSSIVISILYVVIKEAIPQSHLATIILAFIILQSFIFAIIFIRCWLYSSEMKLYGYLR